MPGGPGCVYLGNLSYRAHESDVEKLLSRFGKLRYVSLKSKYGFAVSFSWGVQRTWTDTKILLQSWIEGDKFQ